ncbi:uncharacterized protein LOC130441795 isoform X2 [Diorhabda sublineata]|uniref:uncharacterized protein LOC130441795 isoform X2 n=1 Tax=Diorhabda sublineata TaxID=1163346 RepID=UPI0024E0B176|nr:uncharacterized protein LOC130441795 isoform X2 [Diorhabda sublineata]
MNSLEEVALDTFCLWIIQNPSELRKLKRIWVILRHAKTLVQNLRVSKFFSNTFTSLVGIGRVGQLIQPEASITIKESAFGERDAYTVSISRREVNPDSISHLGSDDFAKVLESGVYIDKSLLIEELFKYDCVLLTAPRGFGKSTNMDMVRRFLEIVTGEDGYPKDIRTTYNYKLFREYELQITKHPKFCKDHMGQHPVMFINFQPLSILNDFDDMVSKFRTILRKTFSSHQYLMKSLGLLMKSSHEHFQKYCDPSENLELTLSEVETGFIYLSELLFLHFKKPVMILIDNYDAYVDSLMFKNNPDTVKILEFIHKITTNLVKSNHYVDKAFLTGVFPIANSGIFTVTANIKSFHFLDNHNYCKYYGVTTDELTEVLKKFIMDPNEREKSERIIAEYYGGYIVPSHNISICNLWSVLNYLDNKRVPLNYWCQSEHYDYFKILFSLKDIADEIQQLLLGLSRCTDVSKPFTNLNFETLNKIINGEDTWGCAPMLILKLLYHLGYLTYNESLTFDQSEVCLKIPNSEVRLEFARILKDTYIRKYLFKEKYIRALHNSANSFTVSSFDTVKFENFCKNLNDLFSSSNYFDEPKDSNDVQNVLFTILASKFCITQAEVYRSNLSNTVDILTVNDSGVGIFLETRILYPEREETDKDVATTAHKQILEKKCCEYFDRNFEATMGKICIGICVDDNKKISIAYSYNFQVEDDIEVSTFLSVV